MALVRSFRKERKSELILSLFSTERQRNSLFRSFLKEVRTVKFHEIPLIYGTEFALFKEGIANFFEKNLDNIFSVTPIKKKKPIFFFKKKKKKKNLFFINKITYI